MLLKKLFDKKSGKVTSHSNEDPINDASAESLYADACELLERYQETPNKTTSDLVRWKKDLEDRFLQAAQKGSTEALITLSSLFSKAMNDGEPGTEFCPGLYRPLGLGFDSEKEQKYLLSAAEKGNPKAQFEYSQKNTTGDISIRKHWLEKSAEQHYPDAILGLCTLYWENKLSPSKDNPYHDLSLAEEYAYCGLQYDDIASRSAYQLACIYGFTFLAVDDGFPNAHEDLGLTLYWLYQSFLMGNSYAKTVFLSLTKKCDRPISDNEIHDWEKDFSSRNYSEKRRVLPAGTKYKYEKK